MSYELRMRIRNRRHVGEGRSAPPASRTAVCHRPALERRPFAAWRFAGANEVVTMTRRFGACIIDAISHVAKRSGTLYGRFGAGILHNNA